MLEYVDSDTASNSRNLQTIQPKTEVLGRQTAMILDPLKQQKNIKHEQLEEQELQLLSELEAEWRVELRKCTLKWQEWERHGDERIKRKSAERSQRQRERERREREIEEMEKVRQEQAERELKEQIAETKRRRSNCKKY